MKVSSSPLDVPTWWVGDGGVYQLNWGMRIGASLIRTHF